jgi:hypothetical protein
VAKAADKSGASTPFLSFPPAIMHNSLDEAKEGIQRLRKRILHEGVHHSEPLVFAVTGGGGCVFSGAMEILQMLPHEIVAVTDLPALMEQPQKSDRQHKIHVVPLGMNDVYGEMEIRILYMTIFKCTLQSTDRSLANDGIVKCGYWDARFPREDGNER